MDGVIAEESWFDDDVTPALFKSELTSRTGDLTVWINSPGGDCFAAAQIYNMLRDYEGKVTVKVDGLAASAASVIAMAGDSVLVSPVSMLMIHNPSTVAMGDSEEMQKAIAMLEEVKNSILNAYQEKTGLSRAKLSRLMDEETWMDAGKAVELHFADGVIGRDFLHAEESDAESDSANEENSANSDSEDPQPSMLFSRYRVAAAMNRKLIDYVRAHEQPASEPENTKPLRKVDDLERRLDFMKKFI